MYITPSVESILVWEAVLFVHKGEHPVETPKDLTLSFSCPLGPYAGSVLKFLMTFPDNYPDRLPTARFLTDVFHPLVATQTGSFNLTARFRPWR
jgi:ubiquitin-protein ligase